MLFFIIQQIILSLVLIAIVHYIYEFFKSNLTEPKIKDLVNKPKAKYEQIYNNVTSTNNETEAPTSDMKVELQNYLSELSKTNNTSEPTGTPLNQNSFFDNNYQSL
jgi:hypothetical protein